MLFVLFVLCIELNEPTRLNAFEILFMIYSLGFSLEKVAAMQEHGVKGVILLNSSPSVLLISMNSSLLQWDVGRYIINGTGFFTD